MAYLHEQGIPLCCGDTGVPGSPNQVLPANLLNKECSIQNRLISSDEQETVSLINHNLISLLNASKYETVNDVVDGVIIWECG
ncbi:MULTISPECIES: hypothetical protein [Nitrosomonas]|uniref:hypothetical protein n=1 Tax=Nitrosomonas TaxID=914 RepID=UPI001187641B|nr:MULTISPECIES: hypothetical protein [Nitrosomonas]UVS60030.1 hypothetical protein NX761_10795 [Nitrosomonas sp. PLL12]